MRKSIFIFLFVVNFLYGAGTPFHRGVNLTGWFQTSSAQEIQFTRFTKDDFIDIMSLGCDVIRLPINLHEMTDGAPNYTIDPLLLYFLDSAVTWAEELEIYLILDNHSFDPSSSTDPDIGYILIPVWRQLATHYEECSTYILYEILNEPHGIADSTWNRIQQSVVDSIREVDQKHTIVVGPAGWNSYHNLSAMPEYDDTNLIYTFHFYDPFVFTHQGATWTNPSMESLAGVPFPYNAAEMPSCPPELVGTWIESSLNNYHNDGTVAHVGDLIDIAVDFKNTRDVPLFCGEFGVYIPNSDNEDRVFWYEVVRTFLEEDSISWTTWDYKGGFGLFEEGSDELFDYDLNVDLLEALGLNVPPQSEYSLEPDTVGFNIYLDYICKNIYMSSWHSEGSLNYYSEGSPYEGQFCIHWTGVEQYSPIGFDFRPIKDLTVLVDSNYFLDFWVRGDSSGIEFDVRFTDTKTEEPGDHPWRMRYIIDDSLAAWDGDWHHIQIPLQQFTEHGSWDEGVWYNPVGDFTWAAVDRFDIVSEHGALQGNLYFDNIRIIKDYSSIPAKDTPGKNLQILGIVSDYSGKFIDIKFRIPESGKVRLEVYNILGEKISTLVDREMMGGIHNIRLVTKQLPGGLYFYLLRFGNSVKTAKYPLIK
jgi:endoglucanase